MKLKGLTLLDRVVITLFMTPLFKPRKKKEQPSRPSHPIDDYYIHGSSEELTHFQLGEDKTKGYQGKGSKTFHVWSQKDYLDESQAPKGFKNRKKQEDVASALETTPETILDNALQYSSRALLRGESPVIYVIDKKKFWEDYQEQVDRKFDPITHSALRLFNKTGGTLEVPTDKEYITPISLSKEELDDHEIRPFNEEELQRIETEINTPSGTPLSVIKENVEKSIINQRKRDALLQKLKEHIGMD